MEKHNKLVSILSVSLIVVMTYFNIAYGKTINTVNIGSDGNNKTTSIISSDVNMDIDMYSKTKYPYSPICSINTKFKSKDGHIVSVRSTGQSVSEDKILTVAHNFTLDSHWLDSILAQADSLNTMDIIEISADVAYNSRDDGETCKKLVWEFGSFEGIEVDFAYDIKNKQHSTDDLYTINKQDIHINKSFVYGQPNFDVAVLITDNAIGRKYGWFGLIDTIYNNQRYSFTGYDTNAFKNVAFTSNTGYFDTTLNNCDNYTYWYKTGTDFLGFSGTALKMKSRWGNDTRVAAIHYGKNSDGKQIGIRMTKELIEWIVGLSKSEQENYLDFSGYNPTGEVYQITDKNKILTKEEKEKYPYSTTCYIRVNYSNGKGKSVYSIGTGQLIGKNTILTCAHNFFEQESKLDALFNTKAIWESRINYMTKLPDLIGSGCRSWEEYEDRFGPIKSVPFYEPLKIPDSLSKYGINTYSLEDESYYYMTDSKYFKSIEVDFSTGIDRLESDGANKHEDTKYIMYVDTQKVKIYNNYIEEGPNKYELGSKVLDDIAIIKLDSNIGEELGWMGISTESIPNKQFEIVGYPDDADGDSSCYMGKTDLVPTTYLNGEMMLCERFKATKGVSGSAIRTAGNTKPVIYGIIRGIHYKETGDVAFSFGRKITSDIVDWLKSEGVFD